MKFIISILLFTFCSFAHADSAGENLTQLLQNMHTLQANFTQKIIDTNGKLLQQSSGRMMLQRPGRFRWEITNPIAQLLVTNGSRLWIYDRDLEQVTIRSLSKAAGQTPALLLSDANLILEKDFVITNSSPQVFLLLPKDKDSMFESMQLSFINNQIRAMQLKDHLGHTTIIQFQNIKFNVPLSAALFNFKPPANIDVIDETKR